MAKKPDTASRIADNKKAAYNYFFEERFEAGLVLEGWEVKSLREGKVQLTDGYVVVRHCFYTAHLGRSGAASETVEGIRALAVDKDHRPRWNPMRVEDVTPEMVAPFFVSPWPPHAHPLRALG